MANLRVPPQSFPTLKPDVQIDFYRRLQGLKNSYLAEALAAAVSETELELLDSELRQHAPSESLRKIASFGLRGELFFAVPCLLLLRPSLLGYYRLLYGFSQKEFYRHRALARFKRLEERNEITKSTKPYVNSLCESLAGAGQIFVERLDYLSIQTIRDLQMLTLGAQLRGNRNTTLGKSATVEVFRLIEEIVRPYIQSQTAQKLELKNESERPVLVSFSSDPDIAITEELPTVVRHLVSIEIKGGTDVSNIHNRIGEAEKSHQKARNQGFFELWTILGADVDPETASSESPTTTRFYALSKLRDEASTEHKDFRDQLHSAIGIKGTS